MPRGVKKENLPSKVCVVCNRPFNWRKKWEKVWDEVSTCSKSCNRKRRDMNRQATRFAQACETAAVDEYKTRSNQADPDPDLVVSLQSDDSDNETGSASATFIDMGSTRNFMNGLDNNESEDESGSQSQQEDPRAARKAAKKRMKAEKPREKDVPTPMLDRKAVILVAGPLIY